MRLCGRLKKAEDRLSSRDPNNRLKQIIKSKTPAEWIKHYSQYSPDWLAQILNEAEKKVGKGYSDDFLKDFPSDFQEKVRAELERMNAAGLQIEEN
jgi:hypothetical protein